MLDIFLIYGRKYPNKKIAKKLYYNVYAPIVNDLLPFMRSYDGGNNDKLFDILRKSRAILSDNFAMSNPAHIKLIDKIIILNIDYLPLAGPEQKRHAKCTMEKGLIKLNKKRKNAFEFFVHDLLIEYNVLRKTLGIKKLTAFQRISLDQFSYQNYQSLLNFLLGICYVLIGMLILLIILVFLNYFFF